MYLILSRIKLKKYFPLAAHPSRTVRALAALAGTALVLAGERVSFTRVIARTPVLAALDGLGRHAS